MSKERITVSIDPNLIAAAAAAVQAGKAESVSAWVNDAMAAKAAEDRRLNALAELIADYEAEFGAFTDEEMEQQAKDDREAAEASRARIARLRGRR
jgi:Arc/MetJ-type ribon-helix-helix transcriptional regulator